MNLIKTKSFELAVCVKGDIESNRLALVLPGKLDTKDYAHMRSHVDFLSSKGFLAVSFDPPGTWESPGGMELYHMTNYIRAVDELIEYFGNKPTLVMGHSRGSTIATIVGAKNPQVFAFVAVMSSFAQGVYKNLEEKNWKDKGYSIEKRDLPPGGGAKLKEFKLPYSFFEDQKKYDLTEDVTSSQKPKLFILGQYDALASPEVVRKSFGLFAEPKQLYELNSGHDYRLDKTLIEQVNAVVGSFLDRIVWPI